MENKFRKVDETTVDETGVDETGINLIHGEIQNLAVTPRELNLESLASCPAESLKATSRVSSCSVSVAATQLPRVSILCTA